jgi:hypothetical protein
MDTRKTWAGDVQVITQHARTENACCEEVTTQISIAAKNASDCLVAVFFCVCVDGGKGQVRSVMDANARQGADGLPFLATMFHAVGLKVIDPRERKRDVLDASTRALVLRDMIAMSWLGTTETPLYHTHARKKFTYIVSVVYATRHPDIYQLILGFIK